MLLRLFERPSRRERVTAQYDSADTAADYARGYDSARAEGRFFRSRLRLVKDVLASCPGGDLLDAGCGPGVMARALLESRPDDFRITVLDQSLAMVTHCASYVSTVGKVFPAVGELERTPFADGSFDVVLLMGVLEYTDIPLAIRHVSRIVRPGGLVIVTMLNPRSAYRLTQWFLYWPLVRVLGAIEKSLGVPAERRHGASVSGIRAIPRPKLQRLLRQADLQPVDVVYFDVTPTVPPLDRLPVMVRMAERTPHGRTVTRGWRRWMGTAYLVAARRNK
jgi:ubiquinone/menaquinone biosynthesis C-methylase UbiE